MNCFVVVQSLTHVWLPVTTWTVSYQASLSFIISQSLLQLSPLSQWCHPTISSSVVPLSPCLQSFPASRSFPMSQLFTSSGQSIGSSASASVLPMNTQELISFRVDWFDLLAVQGTLKNLLQPLFKSIISSALSLLYGPTLTSLASIQVFLKNHSFDYRDLCRKTNVLLCNSPPWGQVESMRCF